MAIDKSKYNPIGGDERKIDAWWPAKGAPLKQNDSIEGRLVGKLENVGKHKSNVWLLELPDGTTTAVWGSTVIDAKMAKIAEGKMVAVEFLGERTSKDEENEYKDFFVGEGIDAVGDEGK